MKAKLVRKHHETENIVTFWFEPERAVDYIAGQYTEMTLPHDQPDEHGIRHWFTLSSSPTDAPLVSITTKFPPHYSSFKHTLRDLKRGQSVSISPSMGDFVLPKDDRIPLVFVAGGIGITPFHSIIKWLIDTKQHRHIQFIYSVRTEKEFVFQDLFERYDMSRTLVVSHPEATWPGETGPLSAERILDMIGEIGNKLIYLSGPEPMVEDFTNGLTELGVPRNQLVTDSFPGYKTV